MEEIRENRTKGWFWAENALIDREDIGAYEKLIYMALARFADSSGKCFPSLDLLMKKCSIGNKSTLRKYLIRLEEKGLIKIIKREGKGSIYYLNNVEPEPKKEPVPNSHPDQICTHTQCKFGHTPSTDLDTHPDQKCTPKETQEGNTIKKTQLKRHNRVQSEQNNFELLCEKIKDKWAENAHDFNLSGTKLKINDKRKKMIKTLLNEYTKEEIFEAMDKIRISKFLQGNNKNNWKATFDWFINKANLLKVLEGNYDDKNEKTGNSSKNNNDFTVTEEGLKKFYGYE